MGDCNLMEGWGLTRGTYLGPLAGAARLGAGEAPLTTAWGVHSNTNGTHCTCRNSILKLLLRVF